MAQRLKRTPLAEEHEKLGARMVDFGGWYMPVTYSGLVEEHTAVREKAGLFDVSHMGEIRVRGKDAADFLNYMTVNNVSKLADGQAHYSVMATPEGTVVDDLLVYRFSATEFWLVVNGAFGETDFEWLKRHLGSWEVGLVDESDHTALIAIQGPRAQAVLQTVTSADLAQIDYYWFRQTEIADMPVLVSRTGYTGEDGFECYIQAAHAVQLWRLLLEKGRAEGLLPAGLGARDTLRLEARMNLSGQDMDQTTTVLEAGLGWVVKLKKPCDFIGKNALKAQKKEGPKRKLLGFELIDKGIARHGYPVVEGDREIGTVTSGSFAPTLKKSIGLAYVPAELAEPGNHIQIKIRNKLASATIVKGPFYSRHGGGGP